LVIEQQLLSTFKSIKKILTLLIGDKGLLRYAPLSKTIHFISKKAKHNSFGKDYEQKPE